MLVRGYTLAHFLIQRVTIPTEGLAQDEISGDAETVLKHYVSRNCLEVSGMEFPNFSVAPNQNRGSSITWKSRYKVLVEELEEISLLTGLGYMIYPDIDKKGFVFEVIQGQDLTTSGGSNNPVVFSPEFDNVKNQEFVDSLIGSSNYALVAGQGEGASREVIEVGSEDKGYDKFVTFIDARDLENSEDLPTRGINKLAELKRITSFLTEILPTGPFKFRETWNLGDRVTVHNRSLGISTDVRVTEIQEVYEAEGYEVHAVFGQAPLTLVDKVKRLLK